MTHRVPHLMRAMLLAVGVAAGATFASWPLSAPVQADAGRLESADRAVRELAGDGDALVAASRRMAAVARRVTPSVVHIQSTHENALRRMVEETGSGIIVASPKASGSYIVTNRHVVEDAELDAVSIHLYDGRIVNPERLWTDRASDVAVLKVDVDGLVPVEWGNSDRLEIGNIVLAMGSPFGLSQSVTFGIVSAKGRRSLKLGGQTAILNQDFLQTDAAINPGNSGGPLVDLEGRVVGINTAIASSSGGNDGIGFSIPSNLVRTIVDQLLEHGRVRRAYLGIRLDPEFDVVAARRYKLDRPRGARVVEVYANTPAARADLQPDDVVLSFNGIDVLDENHLINMVSLTPVGRQVRMVVLRKGRRVPVTVVLSDRPESESRSETPRRPEQRVPIRPMGLTLHPVQPDVAGQLGLQEDTRGLLVLAVEESAAAGEGLRLYDVIEEAAGEPVASADQLAEIVREHAASESIVLKVRRRVGDRVQARLLLWQPSSAH